MKVARLVAVPMLVGVVAGAVGAQTTPKTPPKPAGDSVVLERLHTFATPPLWVSSSYDGTLHCIVANIGTHEVTFRSIKILKPDGNALISKTNVKLSPVDGPNSTARFEASTKDSDGPYIATFTADSRDVRSSMMLTDGNAKFVALLPAD
jgi:hypothetical protein